MSKHLDPAEWLSDAKRLCIGDARRVHHGAESKPNMVVRNMVDRYSAWCHRCNAGGVVMKGQVRLQNTPPLPKERPALSADPGPVYDVYSLTRERQAVILGHLQDKGMSLAYLGGMHPKYSTRDERLVLDTPDCRLGRDVTSRGGAKWHTYTGHCGYARSAFEGFTGACIVLTEDLYSAAKIKWYCPEVLPVACLGTRISPALMVQLIRAQRVIVWFDGDDAGEHGAVKAMRALGTMGVLYSQIKTDVDPKAIKGYEIIRLVQGAT